MYEEWQVVSKEQYDGFYVDHSLATQVGHGPNGIVMRRGLIIGKKFDGQCYQVQVRWADAADQKKPSPNLLTLK